MVNISDNTEAAPPPRKAWKIVLYLILAALLLLAAAAGGTAWYVYKALQPAPEGAPVRVTVIPGTGPTEIAHSLKLQGIIRNDRIFTYYLKYKKEGARFQAGVYEMAPGMELDAVIAKLNEGDTVKEEMLRFTIPEGYTLLQIADKLSQENAVDKETFLQLAESADSWDSTAWASQIPDLPAIKHHLEGYLFPETYEVKKDSTEKEILQRMLAETDRKLSGLPEDWQDRMKQLNLTFHQLLTAASLIEREVAVDEERPIVAGVIYNRLKQDMPLQIDATIQYLFDRPKERLLEKDLKVESPYNTYLHSGLPPGPIASPSLASIKAALYPQETNYLFYVTKKDGSGRHLFAETYEEHKRNIARSKSGG